MGLELNNLKELDPDVNAALIPLQEKLLIQILRELRKEGPEERSKPIKGFGKSGTDASEPYHPF